MITASPLHGQINRFIKVITLFAAVAAITCLTTCSSKNTLDKPPFTVDSLMAYSEAALLTLTDAPNLKDSAYNEKDGVRRWCTQLMAGTPSEVLIYWMDSTRTKMLEVRVRAKAGQPNLWMTRDSIRTGLSLADVERINGRPFSIFSDGSAFGMSSVSGRGALAYNIASITFAIDSFPSNYTMVSNDEKFQKLNPQPQVQSFILDRWMLASQVTVVRKAITVNKKQTEYIPQVVSRYGSPFVNAPSMNKTILDWFKLESYDSVAPGFNWSDVSFTWEQNDGHLALQLSATYLGSYPSEVRETLYFDLRRGAITIGKVPFISFLRYDKFFPFFQKYWLKECLKNLAKVSQCTTEKNTCNCYDNIDVSMVNNKISFSLDSEDCFPRDEIACAPQSTLSLSLDELLPFLNDFGRKHLQQYAGPGLLSKKDTYDAYLSAEASPMLFLKVMDGNVTSVGLQFNSDGTLTGYIDDGEFQDDPEYIGDYMGPFKASGRYDNNGFVISVIEEEGPRERFSVRWSQEPTNIADKGFYLDTEESVSFFKHTSDDWFLSLAAGQEEVGEEAQEEEYSGKLPEDIELTDEVRVVTCSYLGSAQGDCYHYYFSCGDFVAADIDQLSEAEMALWLDLSNYRGRDFQITYTKTEGWPCQAGYPVKSEMTRGDVPLITGFKLLD